MKKDVEWYVLYVIVYIKFENILKNVIYCGYICNIKLGIGKKSIKFREWLFVNIEEGSKFREGYIRGFKCIWDVF